MGVDGIMSERMTGIGLPGLPNGAGIQDYGRQTPKHMIKMLRDWALYQKTNADAILAAKDEDFKIETYVGSLVQKNKEVLQEGK